MDTQSYLPLFVYGTLRSDDPNSSALLEKAVIEHAPAFLAEASLFIGPAYPLAIPSRGGNGIHGEIILIEGHRFPDLLAELDEYEGFIEPGHPDNLYFRSRAKVTVFPDENSNWEGKLHDVSCYVYYATPETYQNQRPELFLSPSGDWANRAAEWAEYNQENSDFDDEDTADDRFED